MESKKIKNRNIRHNSAGITLVALVVTIIVLIILAGISISLVLGENGIIIKSKDAARRTEEARLNEEVATNELMEQWDGLVGGSSNPSNPEEPTEPETPEIALSELKAGDYIKYNTGVTTVGKNGEITCRVLYNDETNGLQIISDKNVANVRLGGSNWETGKTAYNNAIKDLNNEAEKYLNKRYAVDARCVGSLPTVDASGNFTQKDNGTEKTVIIPENLTLPIGWETRDTGCYDTDANYEDDQTAMKAVNIWATGEYYWLASRGVGLTSSYCYFNVRYVATGGGFNHLTICSVINGINPKGKSEEYGLRPCFSLKSDIKITGGDGTSEGTAYTM